MSTAIPSTIPIGVRSRAKNRRDILRMIEELRLSAAEVTREAFPGDLGRFELPRLPASTISKARLGYFCGPYFRAALCILALWAGGADRDRAQRLVDWLQRLVDRLWPPATSEEELREKIRREQRNDAAEDVEQSDYLMGVPGARRRWLTRLRERHALDRELIAGLEAIEEEERRSARERRRVVAS